MKRMVVDSSAVYPLIDAPGGLELVTWAVESDQLELLRTHVLDDEIAATRDLDRRTRMQALLALCRPVPTGAFVFDVSKLGMARLTNDVDAFESLRSQDAPRRRRKSRSGANTNDALIAVTSEYEQCALLSRDIDQCARAAKRGVSVVDPEDLLAALAQLRGASTASEQDLALRPSPSRPPSTHTSWSGSAPG
jgi:hypothetical protein